MLDERLAEKELHERQTRVDMTSERLRALILATTDDEMLADKSAAWFDIELAKLKAKVQNDYRNKSIPPR